MEPEIVGSLNKLTKSQKIHLAKLKTTTIDGIQFLKEETPIGKIYYVDINSARMMSWYNNEAGRQRDLKCVVDVIDGGWIPLEILEIK